MIKFRKFLPNILYWYVSLKDTHADVIFMNYGYADPNNQKIDLNPEEEPHRYSIQLYHHMTDSIDFKNKSVVEIGCGRGGGLSYIVKQCAPASAIGIDLCKKAVKFCSNYYKSKNLSFCHGNAQDLPLENESCDILVNVESSHRYENFEKFISEVYRVLRNDGLFLFADYRSKRNFPTCRRVLELSPFIIIKEEIINQQVVLALQSDWDNKVKVYKQFVPPIFHDIGLYCASKVQLRLIEKFQSYNEKWQSYKKIYFIFILQKQCS
jgi:ubiquinone/menaquinone biosynthesis C-methylase UbiE